MLRSEHRLFLTAARRFCRVENLRRLSHESTPQNDDLLSVVGSARQNRVNADESDRRKSAGSMCYAQNASFRLERLFGGELCLYSIKVGTTSQATLQFEVKLIGRILCSV